MTDKKVEAFKAIIQEKINKLLQDFAEGKLNREQFHVIYDRYNGQLQFAEQALNDAAFLGQNNTSETYVIKEKFMGRAQGLIIYSNRSGSVVETLGNFSIPLTDLLLLDEFTEHMKRGERLEWRVQELEDGRWLLFVGGQFTTVVTVFDHEPSRVQARELERLHRDFETANAALFQRGNVEADKLAVPFHSFVVKKVKGS